MGQEDKVTISRSELQLMIDEAAERGGEVGSRKALAAIGLEDENAARDIADWRDFMRTFRMLRNTALKSLVRSVTNFVFVALLLGVAVKMGIKIGGG